MRIKQFVSTSGDRLPIGPAVVSAFGWIGLLGAAIAWLVKELSVHWSSNVEYQFGWIVVLLAGFLVWERWPTRPKDDRPLNLAWPLVLLVPSASLIFIAELYRHGIARTASASFCLAIGTAGFFVASLLMGYGPRTTRHFLFPVAFFFVAVPMPKILWNPVVSNLQAFVTVLNVEALSLVGIPAVQHGNVIELPNTRVGVDEACSGVRSLQSSIMAALFIGDLVLRRPGWKLVFMVAGICLAVAGNFGRSLFLSLTAYRSGSDALNQVHDTAGWSVLVFTAAGIAGLAALAVRLEKMLLVEGPRQDVGSGGGGVGKAGGT